MILDARDGDDELAGDRDEDSEENGAAGEGRLDPAEGVEASADAPERRTDSLGLGAVGLDAAEDAEPRPPLRRSPERVDADGKPPSVAASAVDSPDPDPDLPTVGEDASADLSSDDVPSLEGPEEIQRAIEAILFSVAEPLTVRALADILEVGVHDVRAAVDELRYEYSASQRAFRLEEIAGGVQILTVSRFDPWLRRLREKERQSRLSAAALETLSVVAYKQPIAKADLEGIRGVDCSAMLRKLMDRGLIDIVGRDEGLGRALLYGTTPRFLESFGLATVRDLPQPEDLLSRAADRERAAGEGGAAVDEDESDGDEAESDGDVADPEPQEADSDHDSDVVRRPAGDRDVTQVREEADRRRV